MPAAQQPPSFLHFYDCVHVAIDNDDEIVKSIGNSMGNVKTTDGRYGKDDTMETIKGSMRLNPTLKTVKEYGNTENRKRYNINI